MAKCKRIQIDRTSVCLGDYKDIIEILQRDIEAPQLGDYQAMEVLTVVDTPFAGIKTLGGINVGAHGVKRFAGVNITDETTHIFLLPFADFYMDIEIKNHFLRYDGRLFRILSVDNINEDELTIMYQCTERGDEDKEASKA